MSKQWGSVKYTSTPNYQVINTPITFSQYFSGWCLDIGINLNTGGTFANIDTNNNNQLCFRPIYGGRDQLPASNGVVLKYGILCQ